MAVEKRVGAGFDQYLDDFGAEFTTNDEEASVALKRLPVNSSLTTTTTILGLSPTRSRAESFFCPPVTRAGLNLNPVSGMAAERQSFGDYHGQRDIHPLILILAYLLQLFYIPFVLFDLLFRSFIALKT